MHIFKYKYVFILDLLDWSIRHGPSSLIMPISYWRNWEPPSDSILKGECLHTPNMALKNWRILEGYWSSVCLGNPENLVVIWVVKCFSNRIDELVSESKGKQEKGTFSFFDVPFFWATTWRNCPYLRWVFQLQKIWFLKKPSKEYPVTCVLVDSRYSQVDNQG